MSSVHLVGDYVFQKLGGEQAELGYIKEDENTGTYVFWVKDYDGKVLGSPGVYIRGDEWPTLVEARESVLESVSVRLAGLRWMELIKFMRSVGVGYGFLAMKFDETEMEEFFSEHIKKVIPKELGYEVMDLKDFHRAGNLIENMRNTIERAKFVIADLTHDNNGAYWESGFAEGKGIPVIYICEKKKFDKYGTHFDTRSLMTVLWSMDEPERFEKELTDTIRRSLKSNN